MTSRIQISFAGLGLIQYTSKVWLLSLSSVRVHVLCVAVLCLVTAVASQSPGGTLILPALVALGTAVSCIYRTLLVIWGSLRTWGDRLLTTSLPVSAACV